MKNIIIQVILVFNFSIYYDILLEDLYKKYDAEIECNKLNDSYVQLKYKVKK